MKLFTVILFCALCANVVFAETPEEKGLAIAQEAERRDKGWGNETSVMEMSLKNRHGDVSVRRIRSKSFEMENDGDKFLMIFDNPRDVKGTSMLTWSHKTKNDDQWLFLPALKRVKRISSSNKSGSFMGSEFAYEDLSSREVEKYTYKHLREEPCPCEELKQETCFVGESYPVDKQSGYTKMVSWLDTKEYRSCKVEFYDRKKTHLKTLTFSGYQQFLGKYWRIKELHMVNHQSGKSTILAFKDQKFKTGLKESDFNQNSLKRAR